MRILRHLPNALTSANLVCGCLAVIEIFSGSLYTAVLLVFFALIFDFLDGFTARLLKVSSPIGKDLDSLADMITFGLVPGLIVFKLIKFSVMAQADPALFWIGVQNNLIGLESEGSDVLAKGTWQPYIALLIPVFSALRLAKFNNDPRQSDSFIGVPTPAITIFIVSLLMNLDRPSELYGIFTNTWVLILLTILCSFSLVAEVPLLALKFKNFSWATNRARYLLLALLLVLLTVFQVKAFPLIIPLYIVFSLVNNIFSKEAH